MAGKYWRATGAATSIEYALIASGIALAITATVILLGSSLTGFFQSVADFL